MLCVSGPGHPGVLCCLPPIPHTPSDPPSLQPLVPACLPPMLDEVTEAAACTLATGEQQALLVRGGVGEVCRAVYGAAAIPLQDAETPLPVRVVVCIALPLVSYVVVVAWPLCTMLQHPYSPFFQGPATCHPVVPLTPTHPTLLFLSFDAHARTTVLLLDGQQLLQHDLDGMVEDARTVFAGYVQRWVLQVTETEALLLDPLVWHGITQHAHVPLCIIMCLCASFSVYGCVCFLFLLKYQWFSVPLTTAGPGDHLAGPLCDQSCSSRRQQRGGGGWGRPARSVRRQPGHVDRCRAS